MRLRGLSSLYLFEWVSIASGLFLILFFILSPVRGPFYLVTLGTLWLFVRIIALSLILLLLTVAFRSLRRGQNQTFVEALQESDLIRGRTWGDLVRISLAFSLMETAHFCLKVYIPLIHSRTFDSFLSQADRVLLAGRDGVDLVSAIFASPTSIRLMDLLYSGFYFFLVWGSLILFLALLRGRERIAFMDAYVTMWQIGLAIYILIPSWGPVFVEPERYAGLLRFMTLTVSIQKQLYLETSSIIQGNYDIVIRYFGMAALPSLHVAVFTIYTLWSPRLFRGLVYFFGGLTLLFFAGSVLTGYHYVVDGLAGIAVAGIATFIGRRFLKRQG